MDKIKNVVMISQHTNTFMADNLQSLLETLMMANGHIIECINDPIIAQV